MFFSLLSAAGLLSLFIVLNSYLHEGSLEKSRKAGEFHETEHLTDTAGMVTSRVAFHDFEAGDPADPALHLAAIGHTGKQSLKMSSAMPFSPGLWTRFRDLPAGGHGWIRATGYVWFSCLPGDVKCSLVATCNHQGANFKYMFIALEKENLVPNRWNKITIDDRIPEPPLGEDILQVYFWYRGNGEMLADDIGVELLRVK